MRHPDHDHLQDPTTFAVDPGSSVRLPGPGDETDVLIADWPVDALAAVART